MMIRSPQAIVQLSSAKPRSGLASISELLPKLIKQYEIQSRFRHRTLPANQPVTQPANPPDRARALKQMTFTW